jgi:predicted O-methyltransferase YrrM
MSIRYYNFASDRPNVDIRHGENLTPDGDYKRKWMRGQTVGVVNLPGWGGPAHFEKKTGYRMPVATGQGSGHPDPLAFLKHKFARRLPQPSPIRCPRYKRKELPKLFQALGYTKGAEIGVREGVFSELLCKGIPDLELLCVDIWGAYYHFDAESGRRHYETAQKRLAPYNATLIKAPSIRAAQGIPDASLDFVYIDADHRFDPVMEDIIEWSKKVRPGGIVSGHDYYRFRNAGVVPAVDVYTHVHAIHEWFITDEKEASFFWVKPDESGTEA